MPGALTNNAELEVLRFLIAAGTGTVPNDQPGQVAVGPVLPLKVALTTTVGDDATPGTEVVKGASGYVRQRVVFSSTLGDGTVANSNVVRFDNMPDVVLNGDGTGGVRGFEIWDSAATPKRWWFAQLTQARGYAAGDAAEFPVGELILAID